MEKSLTVVSKKAGGNVVLFKGTQEEAVKEFKRRVRLMFKELINEGGLLQATIELEKIESKLVEENIRDFEKFYSNLAEEEKLEIQLELLNDLKFELSQQEDKGLEYRDGVINLEISETEYLYFIEDYMNYKDIKNYRGDMRIREILLSGVYEYNYYYKMTFVYCELVKEFIAKYKEILKNKIVNGYFYSMHELEGFYNIMENMMEYSFFYEYVLDYDTKLIIEKEVLKELAEEFSDKEGYVIGYLKERPVAFLDKEHYMNGVKDTMFLEFFNSVDFVVA